MRIKIRRLQQWIESLGSEFLVLYCLAVGYFIFYTDWQDVDEDAKTIVHQGGWQTGVSRAGVAQRDMSVDPFYLPSHVASV
jgi:hypothetical protein